MRDVEHLFICLLVHLCVFFENISIQIFCLFLVGLFFPVSWQFLSGGQSTGGLKQWKCILSQARSLTFGGFGTLFLLLLPAAGGCGCSLTCGHITQVSASFVTWPSLLPG